MQISKENIEFGRPHAGAAKVRRSAWRVVVDTTKKTVASIVALALFVMLTGFIYDFGSQIPAGLKSMKTALHNTQRDIEFRQAKREDTLRVDQQKPSAQSVPSEPKFTPEQERGLAIMEGATANLRACLRSAFGLAYQSGVYGQTNLKSYLRKVCYPSYERAHLASGLGDRELADSFFTLIVGQEISMVLKQ